MELSSPAATAPLPHLAAPSRPTPGVIAMTPRACRAVAVGTLAILFLTNLFYLAFDCPLDLAEDEAYYWDWSRRLDLSYYSKGPLVAYLIRGSCAVLGDTMLGVRMPALVLSLLSGGLTYWLTLRMFHSDRLALGALLLSVLPPIAAARALVMTIDAPLYVCWGFATCFAYLAFFEHRRFAWAGLGTALGIGLLAKFSMALWGVGLVAWLWCDRPSRACVRTAGPWVAALLAVVFATPVLVWNVRHGWLTVLHVGQNIGLGRNSPFSAWNLVDFAAGQFGVMGPFLLALVALVVFRLLREVRSVERDGPVVASTGLRRRAGFLLCMGLPMLAAVFVASFRTNPGGNWASPAYFTLLILTAWALSRQTFLRSRAVRMLFGLAVFTNFTLIFLAYRSESLYAAYGRIAPALGLPQETLRVDPTARLRGWGELGEAIGQELRTLSDGAFVLADTYPNAAAPAFYTPGQPPTYFAGSWFADARHRRALCQYDVWEDRALDRADLVGKDAVFFGEMNDELRAAFEHVEEAPPVVVTRHGVVVRRFQLWRCEGFCGMARPEGRPRYW